MQDQAKREEAASSRALTRFLERRRAQELGIELPLTSAEAAAFINYSVKTIQRMARNGEIPAHPASGQQRHRWDFYASELDAWLRGKVISPRHPCSPSGKVRVQ